MSNFAVFVIAFSLGSASLAVAQQQDCKTVASSAKLTTGSGCFPLTYRPAGGGPEQVVWLPATFTPGPPAPASKVSKIPVPKFQIGVVGTYMDADYNLGKNENVGGFVAFTTRYIGAEADFSGTASSSHNVNETSYVGGPKLQYPTKYLTPYAKAQIGGGHFSGQPNQPAFNNKSFFVEQYAVGVDLTVAKHVRIRVIDAAYQIWPSFSTRGLTPYLYSSGVSFTF